ncbi:MAG: hypothetical protein ABI446_10450 [Gemmatimonadaceae bacterium]
MPEVAATSRYIAADLAGRVPVTIGVTGHRSLLPGDEAAIQAQLRALFARIRREAPHSPMILLSALAEGADRLVARFALGEGIGLIVVLPMRQENYEVDFPDAKSRDEFRALLRDPRVERVIVAPRLDPSADESGPGRDHQYLLAGLFVARNSDVLIALWDGKPTRGVGGSAQIVDFRRTGRLEATEENCRAVALASDSFHVSNAPLDAPQSGLVYHVPVRRLDDVPSSASPQGEWLVPPAFDTSPKMRERFVHNALATLRHRDELNHEGVEYRELRGGRVAASATMLTGGEETPSARDAQAPAALAHLRATFAIADALAIKHQKSIYRMMLILFGMIAVATIALILRNLANEEVRREYLAVYLLLLTLADLFYLRTQWKHSQDRFQDYRAIAEGLRVQFFWRLGGSASSVADYYLRKQRSELRWIRDVLRICALRAPWLAAADFASVQRLWVKQQRAYFDRAGHRDGLKRRRQRSIGSALVLLSLGATVAWLWQRGSGPVVFLVIAGLAGLVLLAHTLYELHHAAGEAESPTRQSLREMLSLGALSVAVAAAFYWLLAKEGPIISAYEPALALNSSRLEWMLAAIGISALIGTFAHAYANVRAFGEHEKQYRRMKELFQAADEALDRAAKSADPEDSTRALFDLGCEALAEHGDWLLLHRARPMELPTADI